MPDQAQSALQVVLTRLGDGEVITDLPPQDLAKPEQPRVVGPLSPRTLNLRLLDGVATRRPGYAALGAAPETDLNRITGLFNAIYDDGSTLLVRATRAKLHTFASSTYTDRSGSATFTNNNDDDYWTFAMCPRLGSVTPKLWCVASDTNNFLKIYAPDAGFGTDFVDVSAAAGYTDSPKGAVALTSFISRCWVGNVLDDSGDRKNVRVISSVVGDSTDWTGNGVVETDLDQDPYPIQQLLVMAGGLVILKGDEFGGSVWRGTPTGLVNTPVRYDAMNPGSGVGILLRRSLVKLSEGVCFFVGHDGFYLYDGVRGFKRVGEGVLKSLLRSINYDYLDAAFAEYKPRSSEILIHVPTGSADTPNITWVYNRRENRIYGPYEYGQELTSSSQFVIAGSYIWYDVEDTGADDLDYSGGWTTLPWNAWNEIGGATGAASIAYGDDDGLIQNDTDETNEDDNGASISSSYETHCIVAEGRMIRGANGQPMQLGPYDMLTLEDVGVEYQSVQAFNPVIEYSVDEGNTWSTVSNNEELPAGTGENQWYAWTPQVTGKRFSVRISADTSVEWHAVHMRFSYAGDSRNG